MWTWLNYNYSLIHLGLPVHFHFSENQTDVVSVAVDLNPLVYLGLVLLHVSQQNVDVVEHLVIPHNLRVRFLQSLEQVEICCVVLFFIWWASINDNGGVLIVFTLLQHIIDHLDLLWGVFCDIVLLVRVIRKFLIGSLSAYIFVRFVVNYRTHSCHRVSKLLACTWIN